MPPASAIYLDRVGRLWPGAREPRLIRRRGSRATSSDLDQFIPIPHGRAPRILVPADNRRAAARSVLRFSAALSARDVATRAAVATALRTVGSRAFPDLLEVAATDSSLVAHLSEVFGTPVRVSISLGTARINQKPVLQLFDSRGRDLGFAKLGDSPATTDLVRREAEALRELGTVDLPPVLEVPQLIHEGTWNDHALLVMSTLPNSPRQRPRRQFEIPVDAMRALEQAFSRPPARLVETAFVITMTRQADRAPSSRFADRFGACLERLVATGGNCEVALGAWHGDWTPWNMSRSRGRIQLWDWERLDTRAPTGLDARHYGVNMIMRRDGVRPESVERGLAIAREALGQHRQPDLVDSLYFAAICGRYLASAWLDHDSPAVRVRELMLDMLDASLPPLGATGE